VKKRIELFSFILIIAVVLSLPSSILNFSNNLSADKVKAIPIITPTSTIIQITAIKKDLYRVTKVIDGDTIKVEINGKNETVRLIGIDSPETTDPRRSIQCFGKEASDKAKEILINKNIFLEKDPTQGDKDKYSRLLRFVFLEDGTNFNKFMVSEGYAHEYTYQNNPYKYQQDFKDAQKTARENKKGLWADNACAIMSPTPIE
jgi:micrococcal nuclease